MRLNLTLCCSFESDFNGRHYYVYQFVDSATLTILNYSSESPLPYKNGDILDCILGIKKKSLYVTEVVDKVK